MIRNNFLYLSAPFTKKEKEIIDGKRKNIKIGGERYNILSCKKKTKGYALLIKKGKPITPPSRINCRCTESSTLKTILLLGGTNSGEIIRDNLTSASINVAMKGFSQEKYYLDYIVGNVAVYIHNLETSGIIHTLLDIINAKLSYKRALLINQDVSNVLPWASDSFPTTIDNYDNINGKIQKPYYISSFRRDNFTIYYSVPSPSHQQIIRALIRTWDEYVNE